MGLVAICLTQGNGVSIKKNCNTQSAGAHMNIATIMLCIMAKIKHKEKRDFIKGKVVPVLN
jgi:hypothetical protein